MGKKKRRAEAGDGASVEPAGAAAVASAEGVAAPEGAPAASPAAPEAAPELPPLSGAPLPLERLPADFLGAFLELCFPDKRLLELCNELSLTTPGYRLSSLPPDQVARVLADEALAAKDARALVDREVRKQLRSPALEGAQLSAAQLGELLDLQSVGDPLVQLGRVTWRALLDGSDEGRQVALGSIEDGIAAIEQQAKAGCVASKKVRPPPPDARAAEEAVKRAERAEKERAAMRDQLAAARGDIALREQKLAEQARELSTLRAEQGRLSAEVARLTAAGEGRALADARRAEAEARSLAEKLRVSEEALHAAQSRAREAEQALQRSAHAAPAAAAPVEEDLPSDEEAATFLLPVLTREFYDSVDRWSLRMQRAAFDKIHRLGNDWRHGSLRALALEGLPGYYRIRVATDVRLIYRRDGNKLEVLSLIDREDLDRYIRQARTRPA